MKKTIFYLALAAVAAVSCVKEQNPGAQAQEKTLAPMEFLACAEKTKTALADDGMSVEWIEGDQVAIFDGSNKNGDADEGQRFEAQSSGAAVLLKGEADPAVQEYYAIYPYGSGHSLKADVFTSTIKAQQTVKAGSMAENCAVVVGKAVAGSTKMEFKNVCTLVKFPLEVERVKSLTLIGNNNEVIAGQFKLSWNDGDPQVTANSEPEVAVTLRDAEGADLVRGDYYFTILPTEFTKGFSVILGMNDGTQQIIRRGAVPALSRNQIFRTQNNIPAAAYKAHESNYVKYNDGFALTYSQLTVQKGAEDAYAKYVNDGAPTVSEEGVYFVGAGSTNVNSTVIGCSKFVLAGDNPSDRAAVALSNYFQPTTGGQYIVLSDLSVTADLTQIFGQSSSNQFESFGSIIVNNCKIDAVNLAVCRFIEKAFTLDTLAIEDSDVLIKGNRADVYMLFSNKTNNISKIHFHNNVFHNKSWTRGTTGTLTKFYLAASSTYSSVADVVVTNNTLSGTYLTNGAKNAPFVHLKTISNSCTYSYNFFVETQPSDNTLTVLVRAEDGEIPQTVNIKANVYYSPNVTGGLGKGNFKAAIAPVSFRSYPLSSEWNPANGIFGYAEGLRYGKLQNGALSDEGEVSSSWGAQRTTTAAVLNRAGYAYSSKVLGNL